MASNYAGFAVNYETTPGDITSVGAGVSVKIRAEGSGSDAAESPLTTDVERRDRGRHSRGDRGRDGRAFSRGEF
jgi:hypothetical protein